MANCEDIRKPIIIPTEVEHLRDGDVHHYDVTAESHEQMQNYADHLRNEHGMCVEIEWKPDRAKQNGNRFGFAGYWNSPYNPKGPPINWREEPTGDPRNN